MVDEIKYLEINEEKYPFFCGLNLLEKIQSKYGSIDNWSNELAGKRNGTKPGEINVPELKYILTEMLNEGERKVNGTKEDKFTQDEAVQIFDVYGILPAFELTQEQVALCVYGKNAITTLNQEMEEAKNQTEK